MIYDNLGLAWLQRGALVAQAVLLGKEEHDAKGSDAWVSGETGPTKIVEKEGREQFTKSQSFHKEIAMDGFNKYPQELATDARIVRLTLRERLTNERDSLQARVNELTGLIDKMNANPGVADLVDEVFKVVR